MGVIDDGEFESNVLHHIRLLGIIDGMVHKSNLQNRSGACVHVNTSLVPVSSFSSDHSDPFRRLFDKHTKSAAVWC